MNLDIVIRLANERDIPELRLLINAAYKELADLGLNYTGSYQDEEITRQRMAGKDIYLALHDSMLVGTVSMERLLPAATGYCNSSSPSCQPVHRAGI